jgi:FtsH-binding integral membrane protein
MSTDLGSTTTDKVFVDRRNRPAPAGAIFLKDNVYYGVILLGILVGYAIMAGSAIVLHGLMPTHGAAQYVVLGAVLVSMIAGVVLALWSNNWLVSAVGYLGLVAAPFGLLFGPFVQEVGIANILIAGCAVTVLSIMLGLVGFSTRTDLSKTIYAPIISVLVFVFVAATVLTLEFQGAHTAFYVVMTSLGLVVFSMLLVLDCNRAKFIPHTLDNAVDSSMVIYLTTLNLFLQAAALLSKFTPR